MPNSYQLLTKSGNNFYFGKTGSKIIKKRSFSDCKKLGYKDKVKKDKKRSSFYEKLYQIYTMLYRY
jgi:hypothetical protein